MHDPRIYAWLGMMAAVEPLSSAAYSAVNQDGGFLMHRAACILEHLASSYEGLATELNCPGSAAWEQFVAPGRVAFGSAADQDGDWEAAWAECRKTFLDGLFACRSLVETTPLSLSFKA